MFALRLVAAPPTGDLIRHYEYIELRMSQYEVGTFDGLSDEARAFYSSRFGPVLYVDRPDFMARVLDWHAEHVDFGD